VLEIIIFVLLVVVGIEGLVSFLAENSGNARVLVGGCGLFLTMFMTVTSLTMWAEPEFKHGFTFLFFLWAGFGVMLMV
jgi:hypothetical protein